MWLNLFYYAVKELRWKTGRQSNAGPYTYSDSQWVGYDDPKSITEKVSEIETLLTALKGLKAALLQN